MTISDAIRPINSTHFGGFIFSVLTTIVSWNDARATRKALSQLTDRELDDIGLCRGDVEDIAG